VPPGTGLGGNTGLRNILIVTIVEIYTLNLCLCVPERDHFLTEQLLRNHLDYIEQPGIYG